MIVKSYNQGNVEIIMTKATEGLYNVVRIVKGKESNIKTFEPYENADEIYDYWMDLELGGDK